MANQKRTSEFIVLRLHSRYAYLLTLAESNPFKHQQPCWMPEAVWMGLNYERLDEAMEAVD